MLGQQHAATQPLSIAVQWLRFANGANDAATANATRIRELGNRIEAIRALGTRDVHLTFERAEALDTEFGPEIDQLLLL